MKYLSFCCYTNGNDGVFCFVTGIPRHFLKKAKIELVGLIKKPVFFNIPVSTLLDALCGFIMKSILDFWASLSDNFVICNLDELYNTTVNCDNMYVSEISEVYLLKIIKDARV